MTKRAKKATAEPAPSWCPQLRYTWTKAQVEAWVTANGDRAFHNGELWTIKAKRIIGSSYTVTFVPTNL